jgi:branched-chain amino acid aminotransferase
MNNKEHRYIIFNSKITEGGKPLFTTDNRAFRYGDALFETIRYHKGIPLLFNDHYNRLRNGMNILKMDTNSFPDIEELKEMIISLVVKNRIFKDARVRLTVFRNDGGLYTPDTNSVSFIIEASPLGSDLYELNAKGLLTGIFTDHPKHPSILSQFKSANSFVNILAGIHKKENNLDDCFVINTESKITESISSNLFMVKDDMLFTPEVSSGCVDGIMRKKLISLIKESGIELHETNGFTEKELINADEIFLTNAIRGIQWVVGLGTVRFYNTLTKKIHKLLIERTEQELEDIS